MYDIANTIFGAAQAIGALVTAAAAAFIYMQYKDSQKKTAFDIYDKISDRMMTVRMLQAQNAEICKIWDGGPEGETLKSINHNHLYLTKMLLQINESMHIILHDKDIKTDVTRATLDGWRENFKNDLRAPLFSEIWKHGSVKSSYSDDFQIFVDQLVAEVEEERAT